jgi:hypothetical protein
MASMNPNDRHRVYMFFMDRYGWQCQFLEADLKTPLLNQPIGVRWANHGWGITGGESPLSPGAAGSHAPAIHLSGR